MARRIDFNLNSLMVKPAAISVVRENSYYDRFSLGLIFEPMVYVFSVLENCNDPYFTHCRKCKYHQRYLKKHKTAICPGGIVYLKNASTRADTLPTNQDNNTYIRQMSKLCRKGFEEGTSLDIQKRVTVPLYMPPFVLSCYKWSYDSHGITTPGAYVLKPNPQEFSDYFKAAPFVFGNVDYEGKVCLGSSAYNVDSSSSDFGEIVNLFFTFQRNNDYFGDALQDNFGSLAGFIGSINSQPNDAERAELISQYGGSSYRGFRQNWHSCEVDPPGCRYIFPPNFNSVYMRDSDLFLIDFAGVHFKVNGLENEYTLEQVEA
jgi:hypothetical protein